MEGDAQAPEAVTRFAHAGSHKRSGRHYYLTVGEQEELARVAWSDEPVSAIADRMKEADRSTRRDRRFALVPLAGVLGYLVLDPIGLDALASISLVVALIGAIVMVVLPSRKPEAIVIDRLLIVVRHASEAQPSPGRVAKMIESASRSMFGQYRRHASLRKRGPWRYQKQQRMSAAAAAAAVASYVSLLDSDTPNYPLIADDMRRAILRVSSGRWREVAQLNQRPSDPWLPTRWGEVRWSLVSLFQQEPVWKVVVALLGFLAAVMAGIVVVVRSLAS